MPMRYHEFRDEIVSYLRQHPRGATWRELKAALRLPYSVPCYTWIRRMEAESGLRRIRGPRGLIWVVTGRRRAHPRGRESRSTAS